MSNPLDDLNPSDREAHRWVALLVSGEASTADARALQHWRRQSPVHEQAFVRARRRWRDYGQAGQALMASGRSPDWVPPSPRISRRAMIGGAAGAAALAGYAVVKPPLDIWPSLAELAADYRTRTGEQRNITLGRQIAVRLNTRTSIAMPRAGDVGDEIRLIAGEAAFTIAPGADRPFDVVAGNGRSSTNGGRFAVRHVDAQVCVTCIEGEVAIAQARQRSVIGKGQQLRYDASGLQATSAVDLDVSTAWQDGTLLFRLTPLSEVVNEINRYRPGRVVLMSADLGASPVNGRFRIQRIDDVLVWIEQAFGIRSRTLPGGIVLLG